MIFSALSISQERRKYLGNYKWYEKGFETNVVRFRREHTVPIFTLPCNDLEMPCEGHRYIFK